MSHRMSTKRDAMCSHLFDILPRQLLYTCLTHLRDPKCNRHLLYDFVSFCRGTFPEMSPKHFLGKFFLCCGLQGVCFPKHHDLLAAGSLKRGKNAVVPEDSTRFYRAGRE